MRSIPVALGAAALLLTPSAATAATVGAHPELFPRFKAGTTDYVSRCAGRPLTLVVHAPLSTKVTVGHRKPDPGNLRVRLTRTGGQGVSVRIAPHHGSARTYHVRCLPVGFPKWTAERHGRPQASYYIVTPAQGSAGAPFVTIFDTHGVPVWWQKVAYLPIDAKLLPDGDLAWSRFTGTPFATSDSPYEERDLDGRTVRRIAAVGVDTDNHDLQAMPNGDYLLLSYVPRAHVDLGPYGGPSDATVLDAEVQEVSRAGKLVWSWSSKDHVTLAESQPWMHAVIAQPAQLANGLTAYDIVHANSVEPDGGSVVISLRHTDAVYEVDRATGAIRWKLGGTPTSQSLTVTGEPAGSLVFSGQHDARILPDGTLTLHDNRTGEIAGPRAVRYRIDAAAGTATQLEQVTDPGAPLSLCCGSARRLPGGDWVTSWGFNPLVRELAPGGRVVFGLRFAGDLFSYRAVPVPPGELSLRALRAGMDAMHGQ